MSLFIPADPKKTLVEQYPELAKHEAFTKLSKEEGIFVWLYASKVSPYAGEERIDRAEKAADDAFGDKKKEEKRKYKALMLPENVREACEIMASFDPEVRERALSIVDQMFNNFAAIGALDVKELLNQVDENGQKIIGWDELSKYTQTAKNVREELTHLVRMKEEAFGFNMKVKGEIAQGKTAHQIVMERKRFAQ